MCLVIYPVGEHITAKCQSEALTEAAGFSNGATERASGQLDFTVDLFLGKNHISINKASRQFFSVSH